MRGRLQKNNNRLHYSLFIIVFFAVLVSITLMAIKTPISKNSQASQLQKPKKIIGGTDAKEGEFPFMVTFVRDNRLKKWGVNRPTRAVYSNISDIKECGGTLINDRWVITAAHCLWFIEDPKTPHLVVAYGFTNLTSSLNARRNLVKASEVFIHEDFKGDPFYDIALIKLDKPVKNIKYPRLSGLDKYYKEGEKLIVIGWGIFSPKLKKAQVDLIEKSYLASIKYVGVYTHEYSLNYINNPNILFAGKKEGGVDACSGDSGGPLLYKEGETWVLIGIISTGRGCAKPNNPGEYANIKEHLPWITKRIYNTTQSSFPKK